MDGCRSAPLDGTSVIHNASPFLHSTEMYVFVKLILCNITFAENIDLYNMTTTDILYFALVHVSIVFYFIYLCSVCFYFYLFIFWPDITQ